MPAQTAGASSAARRLRLRSTLRRTGLLAVALFALTALLHPARSRAASPTPSWSEQILSPAPPARNNAEMAFDGATEDVVLVGGERFANGAKGDSTWLYDGSKWAEQTTAELPPELYAGGVAYDEATEEVVLVDGVINGGIQSGTWTYDGTNWRHQTTTQSTPALYEPAVAYDYETEEVVLFGGLEESGPSAQTWTYNGATWTKQSPAQSPPALFGASMSYDEETGELVLVGGYHGAGVHNETWTYNGETWTKQEPAQSPPAAMDAAMAYDEETGEVVRFGGLTGATQNAETWSYDGSTWTNRTAPDGPSARFTASMAYDEATEALVLFGGEEEPAGEEPSSGPFGETWVFGLPAPAEPSLTEQASEGVTLGGEIKDTATLAEGASPTGKLVFALYEPADTDCEASPVFISEAEVEGNGTYESSYFTPAEAGTYHWIALYYGDAGNEAAFAGCSETGAAVTIAAPLSKGGGGGVKPNPKTTAPPPPAPPLTASSEPTAHLALHSQALKGHGSVLSVGCVVACTVSARARVELPGLRRHIVFAGHVALKAGQESQLSFAVPKAMRKVLTTFLRHHRKAHIKLAVTATMTLPGLLPQTSSIVMSPWTLPQS